MLPNLRDDRSRPVEYPCYASSERRVSLRGLVHPVATGHFGAVMNVTLIRKMVACIFPFPSFRIY